MNIIIIGGSRGIGKAAAIELAKDGNSLLIVGRSQESLENAKKDLTSDTLIYSCDVTNESEVGGLADYIENNFPPDGIVLNAAAFPNPKTGKSVLEPTADELKDILDANIVSHYRIVRRIFPLLCKSSTPRIVIIGSTSGVRRDSGGIYGISKWGLRSFAYNLREEAKKYGVGVSLINPGGTFTETRKKESEHDTHLLETSDIGILVSTVFRLSPQAVIEQIDVRPVTGDTY